MFQSQMRSQFPRHTDLVDVSKMFDDSFNRRCEASSLATSACMMRGSGFPTVSIADAKPVPSPLLAEFGHHRRRQCFNRRCEASSLATWILCDGKEPDRICFNR